MRLSGRIRRPTVQAHPPKSITKKTIFGNVRLAQVGIEGTHNVQSSLVTCINILKRISAHCLPGAPRGKWLDSDEGVPQQGDYTDEATTCLKSWRLEHHMQKTWRRLQTHTKISASRKTYQTHYQTHYQHYSLSFYIHIYIYIDKNPHILYMHA